MVENIKIQEPHGINLDFCAAITGTKATMNPKPPFSLDGSNSRLILSFILWFLIVGCVAIVIIGFQLKNQAQKIKEEESASCDLSSSCTFPKFNAENSDREFAGLIMPILGFSMMGIFYLWSIFRYFGSTKAILEKIRQEDGSESFNGYMNSQRACEIDLGVYFECYHMVRHSSGKGHSHTVKRVTHSERVQIPITAVDDISKPLLINDLTKIDTKAQYLRVNFDRNWIPLDEQTSAIIKTYVDHLTQENEKKDTLFSISLTVEYKGKVTSDTLNTWGLLFSTSSPDGKITSIPWYHSKLVYFFSLVTLWYPIYELLFRSCIVTSSYVFLKTIKVDKPIFGTTTINKPVQHIVHPQIQNVSTEIPPPYGQQQYVNQGDQSQPYYQQPYPQQPYYYSPPQQQYQQPIQMETFNTNQYP